MTPFLQLPPPREAQQVAAFMRSRHHQRQRCLPALFRSRTDYLAYFAAQHLPLHLETLRTCSQSS